MQEAKAVEGLERKQKKAVKMEYQKKGRRVLVLGILILLGILGSKENWSVSSNRESGDGFADILIQIEDEDVGIAIEVKYAEDGNLERECRNALEQIVDKRYTEALELEGIHRILKYGIACYKKKCRVVMAIAEI